MAVQAKSGLLKGMNPVVTIITIVVMLVSVTLGAGWTEQTAAAIGTARETLNPFLEWYYVILVAVFFVFCLWLGVGRYKNVRLGGDTERPEFTTFSWVAMLFAAGTGVGIIFWSIAEPVMHFDANPFAADGSPESAAVAMRLTFFHWGLPGWSIFGLVGLVLAYFSFRHNLPLTIRSALYPFLGHRIHGPIGDLVDSLAVFGTVFGIATTLGLGVQQMNTGLGQVFDLDTTLTLQLGVTAVIMFIATVSVVSGVKRGVRMLSEANFWLSVVIVLFFLLFGPTHYLFALTIESTGEYLQNLLAMTFYTHANKDTGWQAEWTVFFWGWWIAWSPFVGMFIARISRGRTLREFMLGVLLMPTVITFVWIGLFGGTALHQELFGAGGVVEAVSKDVSIAIFHTIEGMGLGLLGQGAAVLVTLLIATYLITSANAGTLVINTILANGDTDPPTIHRVIWGVVLALLTGVLLVAGGLETLQAAVILAGLPFSIVMVIMLLGLVRALEHERYAPRPGTRTVAPTEPWVGMDEAGETLHEPRGTAGPAGEYQPAARTGTDG